MAAIAEDTTLREQMHRIDSLLQEIERMQNPNAQAKTREIVTALMEFHGAALEQMLEKIASSNLAGVPLIESLAEEPKVSGLLLLYSQHPLDLESRVAQGIEKARPYLRAHGGNVELIGIVEGIVRLRLQGSCHGCPSSAVTLRQTIEEAVYEKAPDIAGIEVEEDAASESHHHEPAPSNGHSRVALPIFQ